MTRTLTLIKKLSSPQKATWTLKDHGPVDQYSREVQQPGRPASTSSDPGKLSSCANDPHRTGCH